MYNALGFFYFEKLPYSASDWVLFLSSFKKSLMTNVNRCV